MTGFDPYHKWLGIAPKDQPPNHYRLLGIDLFEADPDAISNAADRQMAHVRSFQTGQNAAISQRLLNEIAAARVCLLNAPRKAEYDAWLRGKLVPSPVAVVVPTPVANSRPVQSKRSKINSTTAALAGTAVVLCLVIAVLLVARSKPNASSVAAKKSPVVAQKEGNPTRESELPEKTAREPAPRLMHQQDTKAPDVPPVVSRQELAKTSSDPVTLVNSIGMKFVFIPPGEFEMGLTPEEKHRVRISRAFYLGMYEVTQGDYETVMGMNPSHFSRNGNGKDKVPSDTSRHPVENVSWEDAMEFCKRLSAMPGERTAHRTYRLPFEAEWEYACRAGTTSKCHCGDDETILAEYDWISANSGMTTQPVGQKKPNAWGLYDIHGNVWEWCMDWFGPYPKSAVTDPTGPTTGNDRVWRGGAFSWGIDRARSGIRGHANPSHHTEGYGCRIVCCLGDEQESYGLAMAKPIQPVLAKQQGEQSAKRLGVPLEQTNSIGMKFILIPPGEFDMGLTPEERHRVRISRAFYLGMHEVMQGEYEKVMGVNPSHFSPNGKGKVLKDTSRHPVENVSWEDAMEFCRRLSAMPDERRVPRSYRLPTEAEWEYACRAGSTSKWCYGDDESVLKDYAWYDGFFTHPVGQKKPNAWGLYDMHGNVWEWCMDRFGPYPKSPVTDPTGPATGTTRVWRGGSFNWCADYALSGMRHHATTDRRSNGYGVRVVCCLAQSKGETIAEKIPPQPEPIPKEPEQAPKEQGESDTAKLPVPDKSAQEKARDLAKELFGADHAAAKGSPEKLSALAARMAQKATETQDAAIQYTLLDIARIISVEAGDITLAVQAVDRMGETFQIDSSALKAESIEAIVKSPHSPEQVSILLESLDSVLEACLAEDDFAMANTLGRAASTLARKSRDGSIVRQVAARNREIEERERMYQKEIVPALKSLKQHPDNPLANSIVGKYTCFVKGDWRNGLPKLAAGEDATIRELAAKEVAGLSESSEKLKVADGWWELAQNDEKHKQQIQAHAADLYQQLPGLSGIDKMRADQRIKLSISGETKATKNMDRRRKVKARIWPPPLPP